MAVCPVNCIACKLIVVFSKHLPIRNCGRPGAELRLELKETFEKLDD